MGRAFVFMVQKFQCIFPRGAARAGLWLRAVGWPSTTGTSKLYVCVATIQLENGGLQPCTPMQVSSCEWCGPEDFSIASEVCMCVCVCVCLKCNPDRFTCLLLNNHLLLKFRYFDNTSTVWNMLNLSKFLYHCPSLLCGFRERVDLGYVRDVLFCF